ncbi:hypothetical protein BG000_010616 [Podila horticola]|nr:hypothetical protein BG000_010616 [Podila horticola]
MSSATLSLGLGARARPVLSTFGRSALIGGLALTGNRSFTTGTEGGGHDVGKLVSTATEKFGLGDNQNWLSDHPYAQKATNFSVSTTIARGAQKLNGERTRPSGSTVATTGAAVENITISTLGRSRHLIQSLILEAQMKFIDRDKSRTVIFAADRYGAWRRTKSRPKRPLDTIVMDPKLKNYIVEDAKEFFASESWYAERGLPFRRGLLLYGSPGTGKTSFIHALAGELGLNIYVVNLSSKTISDDTLSELVSDTPSRCLLLIEDVDAAFVQRESKDAATGITFSGLLNSVDGVSAQEGRMLCMTTNHLDRLDEALIRPGRVDVRAKFGKATQSQAQELFIKFFPQSPAKEPSLVVKKKETDETISEKAVLEEKKPLLEDIKAAQQESAMPSKKETEELAAAFAKQIPDQTFSIAQLQGGTAKIGYDDEEDHGKGVASYWEGSEEQQREKEELRVEKEKARRDSINQ